jgi:hypothetical protein
MSPPARPPAPKVRNLRTQAINRRETFWQIALPLALTVAGALTLMGLVIAGTVARTSALADVSLMFLILISAVAGVVMLVLLTGLCVGVWFALRELPYLFKRAQDFAALVAQHTKRITAPLAEGVLSAQSVIAAAQQAAISVRTLFTSGR